MKSLKGMEKRFKNLSALDITLLQGSMVVFGLFMAKRHPELMVNNVWVILGVALILYLKPGYSFFIKK